MTHRQHLIYTTTIVFLCVAGASAQQNDVAPRKMLYTFLLAEAQKHFDTRRAEIADLKSPADVQRRQKTLKAKFVEALGEFPDKTPLNAQTVGKAQRDGYRIERVIYESRPHHHVTATLYLPDGKGPFPGVIMPIGHSNNGKAADYVQRGCILLAKNGLAALAYDPIGQGERRQILDKEGKPALSNSTTEHTLTGVGAMLVGQGTATYRIWDGIRSLDYLAGRPEIDAKRLGCTGCSGGGTLTSYLMALDERIIAAAPSCYITSLERLFATIGPQDAEQNIPGQVAFGMEHADYLTLRAPNPTLIIAATKDFFDIQGARTSFKEAQQVYAAFGQQDRVKMVETNTGHGYPKSHREAAVSFMRRWLLNQVDAVIEPDIAIAKDADLYCTRSGQVLEDFRGKSVFHLNAERTAELANKRVMAAAPKADMIKTSIRRLIGLPDAIKPARQKGNVFETEPGITVASAHLMTVNPNPPALVLHVHDQGKDSEAAQLAHAELTKAGYDVLALDLRGLGNTAPSMPGKAKPGYFGNDFKEAFLALHLNRPLLGQRVFDLLAIIEALKQDPKTANLPIHVIGVGTAGPIVLHAAALEPRIERVIVEKGVISWTAVVRTPLNFNQLTNVVPNALSVYDLPDLARLIAPRPLTIRNAVDPVLDPVTQAVLDNAYVDARHAYDGQNASKNLVLMGR